MAKKSNGMAGYLGTGLANRAANAFVNRHNVIEDMVSGSAGSKGAASGKRGQGRKK